MKRSLFIGLNPRQMLKSLFLTVLWAPGILVLQACNDSDSDSLPFDRHKDGTVTDRKGVTCKADDGNWAQCYQQNFQSKCENGKAVVCGNTYTNYEIFENECDCKMVNGKATCGECEPGQLDASKESEGTINICSPAGLWVEHTFKRVHPDELKACNPDTYQTKCDNNNVYFTCDENGLINAVDCNNYDYYGRPSTCIEVDEVLEEAEFNQYSLLCESVVHQAYCAECKPGEEAENVCTSFYSLSTAPMKCSEFGFWLDKATGGIPQTMRCDNGCAEGKCLGKPTGCKPGEVADHVCYTEDSFVIDQVTCMSTGERWADFSEPLRIQYCAKGCKDNVCLN